MATVHWNQPGMPALVEDAHRCSCSQQPVTSSRADSQPHQALTTSLVPPTLDGLRGVGSARASLRGAARRPLRSTLRRVCLACRPSCSLGSSSSSSSQGLGRDVRLHGCWLGGRKTG